MKTLLMIFSVLSWSLAAEFPPTFKRCKKTDDNCLSEAIADAIGKLIKSIPDAGLPNLEPLMVSSIEIGANDNSPVSLNQILKNVKLFGFSQIKGFKSHWDFDKGEFTSSYKVNLTLKSDYELNGKVLVLPVTGKGTCVITMDNIMVKPMFRFKEIVKHGKKFLDVYDSKVTFVAVSVHYQFNNLFDGNKELGDNINKVLNENWSEVFSEIKEGYEGVFAQILQSTAHTFFSRVPATEIFLDY